MRYWRPFVEETAREVAALAPDEVVLLPLYPQFSTTTTASSLKAWREAYEGPGEVRAVCCYPAEAGLVKPCPADRERLGAGGQPEGLRLLFSAHGLPQKVRRRRRSLSAWQVEGPARGGRSGWAGLGRLDRCATRAGSGRWSGWAHDRRGNRGRRAGVARGCW